MVYGTNTIICNTGVYYEINVQVFDKLVPDVTSFSVMLPCYLPNIFKVCYAV